MIIGLTGPIGSGKSTAAKLLASKGAAVVDADRIGRDLLVQDPKIQKRIIRAFGPSILSTKGEIDRAKLAQLAFRSNTARTKLNRIVHPALIREIYRQTKAASADKRIAVIDAALLLEWRMNRQVDLVVVVGAPQRLRLQRLIERGSTRADALRRMKLQHSAREFHKAADVLLDNRGTKADLRRAVAYLWRQVVRPKEIR